MRLSHNMFSLSIYKNYKTTLAENSKALGNISSGKKLNSAKDNPNKIAQSENLKIQLLAREAAVSNIQDTNSMLQTYDGTLQEVNNNLSRLKELTVKTGSGIYQDGDKEIIQNEIESIKSSIDKLVKGTTFNGIALNVDGSTMDSPTTKDATIGAVANEKIDIPFYDVSINGLGINDIDITNTNIGDKALDKVDKAIDMVSRIRSKYGAIQNRLEDTILSTNEINESYSKAQSSLEDSDFAEEMVEYCRSQILYQSSIALMAQSNNFPKDALNILASVK